MRPLPPRRNHREGVAPVELRRVLRVALVPVLRLPVLDPAPVGDLDYFIKNLTPDPVAGVLAQFEQSRDELDCAAEAATQTEGDGCTCYEYASCGALGQLCVYSDTGHEIRPSMTPLAWCYLTGAACDDSLSVNSAEAGRPLVLVTAAATTLLAWAVGYLF